MFREYRILVRVIPILVLLAGLLVAPPGPVWACSCAMGQGPDVALSQADAVFSGTVSAVVDRGGFNALDWVRQFFGLPPQGVGGASRLVTLAVTDSWKGVTQSPVTIGTGSGSADCGYGFNVGGQYLVYAYGTDISLVTNICMRTGELSQVPGDVAYLQTRPTLAVTQTGSAAPLWCLAGAVVGLALLAIAAGAGWAWRRRARAAPRA